MSKLLTKYKKLSKPWKIVTWIIGTILTLVLLIDLCITGRVFYAVQYVRCGHSPVIVGHSLLDGIWGGNIPGYVLHGRIYYSDKIRSQSHYYCTQDEARTAGIEPDGFMEVEQRRRSMLYRLNDEY